jgi:DNA repair exonuclease SbcCD ATPase subunit
LSTLTKVLIVLLTVASIFLCGVVVTYVASANHYKEMYDGRRSSETRAVQAKERIVEEWNAAQKTMAEEKTKLNADIAALQAQIASLGGQLKDAITARDGAMRREAKWESILVDHNKTVDRNTQLQRDALAAEAQLKAEQTRLNKQLEDITKALNEKMAIVMQLEAKLRGLTEEKTAIQGKLDRFLSQYGKITAQAAPVPGIRDAARVAPPVTDIDLKGLLTTVDLKNNLAELSIGAADGVKKNMRFHAVRDNRFICDIVVSDVEPDKAVGWLELLQDQANDKPRAGDAVSTNL